MEMEMTVLALGVISRCFGPILDMVDEEGVGEVKMENAHHVMSLNKRFIDHR